MDNIINFYEKMGDGIKHAIKMPKSWKNHHIYNNSMIMCIGGTGAGKTNALLNYLARSSGEFSKIIIFTGSITDEPLYKILIEKNPEINIYNNIDELPDLEDFDNKKKDLPKLIIFDDFINLKPKEMTKINKYLTQGRKYGFSCWLMGQSYTSIPKIISRNIQYYILFKINDNVSIDRILRNHNVFDIDHDLIKKVYQYCTKDPLNFLLIDLKTQNNNERFRRNFLDFIKL
jgi:hypothetical protein